MLMPVVPLYRQDAERHPQAQVCAACVVRREALLGALGDEGLDEIHTHIAAVSLAPGDPVYGRGERGDALYTLRSGIVRFERVSERGDRRIVRLAGRADLIGQPALLGQPFGDDAIACTPVEMCRLPASMIESLGSTRPALLRELMLRWQRALEDAEDWLADLTSGPARRRLLRLLLKLGDYAEPGAALWMPQRDEIGAMLNMTVETASRLISQLRREGLLVLEGPRGARVDAAALRAALQREDIA